MTVKYFLWDEDENITEEFDENFDRTVAYTHEPGLYGDLISQRRGGNTSYYHYDGLGSTRELTDETETITDTYNSNAWGEELTHTGTTKNPFRWNGRSGYYWNEATEDYAVRERVYEPTEARWISVDPAGFIDGVNRYLYVASNPINQVDPSGMLSTRLIGGGAKTCGLVCYAADWILGPMERNGFIIQRVTVSMLAKACMTDNYAYFTKCSEGGGLTFGNDSNAAGTLQYFEMWIIRDGDVFVDRGNLYPNTVAHDRLGVCINDTKSKTINSFRLSAKAAFFPAKHSGQAWADPPLGWNSWKRGGVQWAGSLLSTCASKAQGIHFPKLGTVRRSIEYEWDCCCPRCKAFVKWNLSDSSTPDGSLSLDGCEGPRNCANSDCSRK